MIPKPPRPGEYEKRELRRLESFLESDAHGGWRDHRYQRALASVGRLRLRLARFNKTT
jgi:hypothetical protein